MPQMPETLQASSQLLNVCPFARFFDLAEQCTSVGAHNLHRLEHRAMQSLGQTGLKPATVPSVLVFMFVPWLTFGYSIQRVPCHVAAVAKAPLLKF